MTFALLSIAIGAVLGAWLRWALALSFNAVFPTMPLGTLLSNLIGGYFIGMFLILTKGRLFLSEPLRLAITTGFLGGLTTFSTFSAEIVTLLSDQNYLWVGITIFCHVVGAIFMTILGIYTIKLLFP